MSLINTTCACVQLGIEQCFDRLIMPRKRPLKRMEVVRMTPEYYALKTRLVVMRIPIGYTANEVAKFLGDRSPRAVFRMRWRSGIRCYNKRRGVYDQVVEEQMQDAA